MVNQICGNLIWEVRRYVGCYLIWTFILFRWAEDLSKNDLWNFYNQTSCANNKFWCLFRLCLVNTIHWIVRAIKWFHPLSSGFQSDLGLKSCLFMIHTILFYNGIFIISDQIITTTGSAFAANLTCEFKSRLIPRVDPIPLSVSAIVTNQSPVRFWFTRITILWVRQSVKPPCISESWKVYHPRPLKRQLKHQMVTMATSLLAKK